MSKVFNHIYFRELLLLAARLRVYIRSPVQIMQIRTQPHVAGFSMFVQRVRLLKDFMQAHLMIIRLGFLIKIVFLNGTKTERMLEP